MFESSYFYLHTHTHTHTHTRQICGPCQITNDCARCTYCLDKPKFGGPGRLKQKCKLRMCLNLKKSSSSSTPIYQRRRNKIKRSWNDRGDVYGFLGKSVLYEDESGVLIRGILKQWSRGDDFIPPLWQVAPTNFDKKSPRTFYLREVVHAVTEGMRPIDSGERLFI